MIIYMKRYTRADLRANPNVWFVYGDNVAGVGFGGQAGEARGEPNGFGIMTKAAPSVFFSDADRRSILPMLRFQFNLLDQRLKAGHPVVWPLDGIGTGLAEMADKCPLLWKDLNDLCAELDIVNGLAPQVED